MHATFSPRTNMAYVYLTEASDARTVDYTEPLIIDLPHGLRRLINLDFDADGRLIGVEVDGAADTLSLGFLAAAEKPRSE
jgi:uncharacterized protein YuzE